MNAREKVESSEQILVEILTCLPPKSIFRFMCVSKKWEKIINNPFFLKSYSRRRRCSDGGRILALFQRSNSPYQNHDMINLVCKHPTNMLTVNRTSWGDRINNIPRQFGRCITCSNGLILCSPDDVVQFFVVNPVTGKSVTLPPPPPPPPESSLYPDNKQVSLGLMCEENTSELKPNFVVIRAFTRIHTLSDDISMLIQTYSSTTGEWTLSTLVASDPIYLLFGDPLVVNGVFYWREFNDNIVVYDPKNKDQNKVQLIQQPFSCVRQIGLSPVGILWSSNVNYKDQSIELWMLPKNGEDGRYKTIPKDEWIFKYKICLSHKEDEKTRIEFDCFISWDPIVVLLHDWKLGKFILYNVESESIVETVEYDGALAFGDQFYSHERICPPLIESSFLSSYAL